MKPWEAEPDALDFEADGLPCAMRRNQFSVWCGYVGVGPKHPLFGLPTNHLLKLPMSWFDHRRVNQGHGPMDLVLHVLGGKALDEACEIALAFEVHGGVSWAGEADGVNYQPPLPTSEHWWFGFDCGHAGDLAPGVNIETSPVFKALMDTMPDDMRRAMTKTMAGTNLVYRDQAYVVGECQSLAAQLVSIVKVLQTRARAT